MSETGGGVVYDGQPLPGVTVDLLPWPDPAVPGPADQLGTADQIHEAGASPAPSHATNSPHQPDLEAATALTRDQPNWGGRIALTTPTCFAGYLGDPIATAAVRHGQTFLSADRGTWANGRLVVTGRIDDVVQSGGVNVDLAELQGHLDAVFGTDQVVAFAIPDPRWGARIMAATVSRFTVVDVVDRLGARVAPAARPRSVLRLAALPLLASGKIDRRELTARWEELAHGDSR
jgi:acyl-CoA synthetase (AMP-forming)/AMP-acid ligase II